MPILQLIFLHDGQDEGNAFLIDVIEGAVDHKVEFYRVHPGTGFAG